MELRRKDFIIPHVAQESEGMGIHVAVNRYRDTSGRGPRIWGTGEAQKEAAEKGCILSQGFSSLTFPFTFALPHFTGVL